MSRLGSICRAARRAGPVALAIAAAFGPLVAKGQNGPPGPGPGVLPGRVVVSTPSAPGEPGTAVVGGPVIEEPPGPVLAPEIQVVRFQGPAGVKVEVLGPNPEPVPVGDGRGLLNVGLKVGTPYRLRVSELPDRPGAEVFPVIEIVGHLHRPVGIDPGKYPIRVVFGLLDFEDVVDRGRLVTQVIYLEDPEQALPIALPKDEIPVVSLNPSEEPVRVAAALGRVVAVVRMGGRRPTSDDPGFGAHGVDGPGAGGPCPFSQGEGVKCTVPRGPVCGTPPPPGRTWMPKDEYLCDGGDHGTPAGFSGEGGLAGINPKDAVISFDDGRRTRALPTNVVCVYAPRFSEVRTSVGPNETLTIAHAVGTRTIEKEASESGRQGPSRLTQNQGAEAALHRERASALGSRVRAGVHSELQAAVGFDNAASLAAKANAQRVEQSKIREKAARMSDRTRSIGIKTAETAVITGLIEGAGQTVMAWVPRETVGVETPPNRPGLAVIKRVSATEALPGDTLTYVIQYRNMGNTPIHDVKVVDSLLPRLGYIKGTALGPKGTTFSAVENDAGSTELIWILPTTLPPGVEGHVSFQAIVR